MECDAIDKLMPHLERGSYTGANDHKMRTSLLYNLNQRREIKESTRGSGLTSRVLTDAL
jgi:hypothetical protein